MLLEELPTSKPSGETSQEPRAENMSSANLLKGPTRRQSSHATPGRISHLMTVTNAPERRCDMAIQFKMTQFLRTPDVTTYIETSVVNVRLPNAKKEVDYLDRYIQYCINRHGTT